LAVALYYNPYRVGDREQAAVPVLEVASGRQRRRFKGHTDHVGALAFSADGTILATGSRDSTILLWDMKRPAGPDPAAEKQAAERLGFCWNKLAEDDAVCAYDAVLALAEIPGLSVPFLAQQVKPVQSVSSKDLAKWIGDLDDGSYKVRAKASAKLAGLHELARPALNRALNDNLSVEARRRIEKLIAQLDADHSPARLRELRAVEVLERIGREDAGQYLEVLAGGAPEAILTIEARAAVARLKTMR
jgi:hypothetical protein